MLSAVLHSARAVHMSIAITRTFIPMREMIAAHRRPRLERGHSRTASVIGILEQDIDRLPGDLKKMEALPFPQSVRWGSIYRFAVWAPLPGIR